MYLLLNLLFYSWNSNGDGFRIFHTIMCLRNSIHSSNRLPRWFLEHSPLPPLAAWRFPHPSILGQFHLGLLQSVLPLLHQGCPFQVVPDHLLRRRQQSVAPSPAKSSTSWLWWNSICWILLKGWKLRKSPFLMETMKLMKKSNGHHLQTGDVNGWLIGTNDDL